MEIYKSLVLSRQPCFSWLCHTYDPATHIPQYQSQIRMPKNDQVYNSDAKKSEFSILCTMYDSGGSSVGQNKLLQLILGYIYILKHLQSNFIGKILFFGNS